MNKYFEEYLKRVFSDDELPENFFCPVPGVADGPNSGVMGGFLTITRAEMKALFDPVISKIVTLVEQQIKGVEALNRKVKVRSEQQPSQLTIELIREQGVVLVGGFGASEYLRKRLKDVCDLKDIDLYNPENA